MKTEKKNKNLSTNRIRQQEVNDLLFYTGYALFLIGQILGHTLINVSANYRYIIIVIGTVLVGIKIIYSNLNFTKIKINSTFLFMLLLIFVSMISAHNSQEPIVMLNIIFILGASNENFDRILKVFVYIATIILVITIIGYMFGLVPDGQFERGEVVRHTFGYRHPTDFVQLIVYIFLADMYLALKDNKSILGRVILYFGMGIFTLIECGSRLGSGTIFLLIPSIFILKYGKKYMNRKWIKVVERYIFLLCTCISIFVMNLFMRSPNAFLQNLNAWTSYRLTNTEMGINFFGYTLWGQNIYSTINQYFSGWFYIDSSYYIFLLQYGIILLVLIEIGYIRVIKNCQENKNYILPFICLIIALDSLIDQQFYLLEYNVFLMLPFAMKDVVKLDYHNIEEL